MPRRRPRPATAIQSLSPLRILTQIILLQTAFYITGTILLLFTSLVAGRRFYLGMVWDWRIVRGDTVDGWMWALCWMLVGFAGIIFLLILVARSKLVLDFALTIHFTHLIATSLYSHSLPRNFLWWGLQICSAALMTAGGIWSCQWRELRPMSFGAAAKVVKVVNAVSGVDDAGDDHSTTNESVQGGGGAEDEEVGFGRGRGRGKGRDGGEYEMLRMKGAGADNV
ncbi:MAG: hypothetical protein MMC33_005911 [Icmadophila ericetorum]|nr:hypothetical protein [Icmadophila ericetorum]